MKNLTEFLSVCNSKTIPESEMNNFIREYTNNFDIKSLEYLRKDLNKLTDNIKFTLINETLHEDGAVEQQDRPTTVVSYLKTNKIDPDTWTPRQKVDFVLNDIENKKLTYYADESIFRYEFEQYLKFTDMIEREYKDRLQPEVETNNFDSDDTTNPLIFDMDLITGLHNNFRTYIFETTDIDTFKNYFRERPMPIKIRAGITISELCYLFGKIERKKRGVSNFAEWMKNHIEGNNYGVNKKKLIELAENAKEKRNGFSLTAPQEKALENKEKIDNKIKLMQID